MLKRTAIALTTLACMQTAQAYDPAMEQERERLLSLYHNSDTAAVSNDVSARYTSQAFPVERHVNAEPNKVISNSAENNRLLTFSEFTF